MIHSEDERKRTAWNKAPRDMAQDRHDKRNDYCGNPIRWSEYGESTVAIRMVRRSH